MVCIYVCMAIVKLFTADTYGALNADLLVANEESFSDNSINTAW